MDLLHFTCTWNPPKISLSANKPDNLDLVGTVWWKKQVLIHLYANAPEFSLKKIKYHKGVYALLKSNLQKQIRRGKRSAIATAAKMWDLDSFELLRRLIIISAEDAQISVESAVLSWLMMARSKGFLLGGDHKIWVLGYVQALLEEPNQNYPKANCQSVNDILNSDHPHCEQLAAILLRAGYGGLHCDPPLIVNAVNYYINSQIPLPSLSIKPLEKLGPLQINPAAIDFHIYPYILTKLSQKHPQWTRDYLRHVIWHCSSNINYRKKVNIANLLPCWNAIKDDFRTFGNYYLNKLVTTSNGIIP